MNEFALPNLYWSATNYFALPLAVMTWAWPVSLAAESCLWESSTRRYITIYSSSPLGIRSHCCQFLPLCQCTFLADYFAINVPSLRLRLFWPTISLVHIALSDHVIIVRILPLFKWESSQAPVTEIIFNLPLDQFLWLSLIFFYFQWACESVSISIASSDLVLFRISLPTLLRTP